MYKAEWTKQKIESLAWLKKKGEFRYKPKKLSVGVVSQGGRVYIPKSALENRKYPICRVCDGKYVPIIKGDKLCFRCKFKTI